MPRYPQPRAARLALLLAVAQSLPGTDATAQNQPAGVPAGTPAASTPPAEKPSGLKEAALKPATADSSPAPAETPAPPPEVPRTEEPPLPSEAPPDPPPIPSFGKGAAEDDTLPPDFAHSVTMILIKKLVKRNVISAEDAEQMILQAETEARAVRAQEKAAKKKDAAEEDDAMRVSYVPEVVRKQMEDRVRQQVLAELRSSGDKSVPNLPDLKEEGEQGLFGDLRLRYELVDFASGNANDGLFPNFNAINTGAPFDVTGPVFSPQYNVDKDRERYRLRFRIGDEFLLENKWRAGFRIATGENTSPTTTNQSVGLANQGSGGNFSKYAIWLDRAFMRWDHEWENKSSLTFWGGRFENPFFSTEIIFDEDVGIDGLALKFKPWMGDKVKPFITVAAAPIFNTDLNFSSNQPAKFDSTDKYLYAAQLGADFKLAKDLTGRLSAAYYIFDGVEGKLSTPYTPINAQDAGDTDNTRPSFAQRGNTYRPLRQIIPDATNGFGTTNQWQYYGLATPFRPLTVTGKLDWDHFEPVRVTAYAEYIKNTAFDRDAVAGIAVNNRGPVPTGGTTGAFEGGDTAWIAGIKVGHAALDKRGAWQAGFNYRHVESDAVVDGLADSEFGGGGTNVKGWTLGGTWALSKSTAFGVSWLSSSQVAGPPLKTDFFQVDFKIKF